MAYSDQQVADFIRSQNIANNPSAIYSAAQQYGVDAAQLDRVGAANGWWGNTGATDWVTSKGLAGALGTQPQTATSGNLLGLGAAPGPANNSPANPYLSGGPSTAGSTPATMPATSSGNGTVGVPDYMVSPSSNPYTQPQQRNPYQQPAGGPGANFGNDPRSGMAGLGRYLSENPHMLAMGNEITRGVNDNLQRNIMPGIRGNAMQAGTVGGSRQGVAEGLATGESMKGLAGALANLYGGQFNQDRGYGLQSDALDFGIHRGNLQDMRQGQLDQLGFLDQMTKWGQQGVGVANQTRDRPFTDWQRFVGPASQMAGLGGQQTQTLQGNPYLGALGGYMTGSKVFGG